MKKVIYLAISMTAFFLGMFDVMASDIPKMKIIDGPVKEITINLGHMQSKESGQFECGDIYLYWEEKKALGFLWGTGEYNYSLSIVYPTINSFEVMRATNSASDPNTALNCHYETQANSYHPHVEFEVTYQKTSQSKEKHTSCSYKHANTSLDSKLEFTIYKDFSVGNISITTAGSSNTNIEYDGVVDGTCPQYIFYTAGISKDKISPLKSPNDIPFYADKNAYYVYQNEVLDPTEERGIATYVKSNTSNVKIIVRSVGGKYTYTLYRNNTDNSITNTSTDITSNIKNPNNLSISFGGNNSGAPTYLVFDKNEESYTFQNKTSFGADNYILLDKINQLYLENDKDLEDTCFALFGDSKSGFNSFLSNNVFRIVYIAVPIILILLTSFDFAKAVFNSDNDGIQGAFKKFGKRVVAAVLIYLVPTIIIFASSLIGGSEISECARQLQNLSSELGDE